MVHELYVFIIQYDVVKSPEQPGVGMGWVLCIKPIHYVSWLYNNYLLHKYILFIFLSIYFIFALIFLNVAILW